MEETGSEKKQQQKEYEQYVKQITPTHNLWLQMLKAFITGGVICCIGQFILNGIGQADRCKLVFFAAGVFVCGADGI